MSHFAVIVIIPKEIFGEERRREERVKAFITLHMDQYDENLELPRYIQYTKQQLIEKGRKEIERYAKEGAYSAYLADPEAYLKKCRGDRNDKHFKYVSEEFPRKLMFTDEQVFADETEYDEPEDLDAEGNRWSTSNPKAKWDWYRVGGRWCGWLQNREKELETDRGFNFNSPENVADNYCTAEEGITRSLIPFAVITPDGQWNERGEMGWFGISHNEMDEKEWVEKVITLYAQFPGHYLVSLDCHT